MYPLIRRILFHRPFQIGVGVLVLYALLGFLLLPVLIERALPNYVRDTLHRQGSVAAVRINPFLLTLTAENLKLNEAGGQPIAAVRRLAVDFETSSLFHWAWTFRDVRVEGLDLHIERAPKGELNLAALLDSLPKNPQPAPKDNAPPRLLLWDVALVDARLTYLDRAGKTPADIAFAPVDLEFKELTTLPERRGSIALNATLAGGGRLSGRGELALRPFAATGNFSIKGFPAATAWPFLRDRLRLAELKGVLDLDSGFRAVSGKSAAQFTLSDIHLRATGLELREPDAQAPLLALATLDAPGGEIDLSQHKVTLPQLVLSDGRFGLDIAKNGTVNWAQLSVADAAPPATAPVAWSVALDKVQLANIAVQVADRSRPVPLTLAVGQLGATLKLGIATGAATRITADNVGIDLAKVALQPEGDAEPALTLGAASLSGGALDTGARTVAIGSVSVRDGQAQLARSADGKLRLFDAFATGDKPSPAPVATSTPWRYRLSTLQLVNCKAHLSDASYQPPLTTDLDEIAVTLNDLANDDKSALRFDAALHMVEGGHVSATGTVAADHRSAQGKLISEKVNLVPLQPLIARHTTLSLKTGTVSSATEWKYTTNNQSDVELSADSTAGIDGLLLKETRSGDRFLGCKSVAANGIHYRSAPGQLLIDDVRVIEPDVKVLIFPDRTINLIKAFDKNGADKGASQQAAAPVAEKHFPVKVTRVRVERGKVDYADQSLVLPFSTKVSDFNGTVTDISSDPDSRAKVRLAGRVEEYGSARVYGTLSPFAPKHFTDIRTKFTNVEMPKLSPYSVTFAGREIASGKLSLDLEYKIEDGKLTGNNLVLLDHFTLGKAVPSKDALDLPLDLAVALLTDSSGHIDLTVPVTGDLTKPDFAMGKVVGKAIAQVLTKIITAPFRALGSLFGGGDKQQFDAVVFGPGSTQLAPPEVEKLKQLAGALAQRTQLKLMVEGRYDPKKDGNALRAEHVRRAVSAELDIKLGADERAAPVVFDEAQSQRALEAIYRKRAGDHAVDIFQTQYEAKAGKHIERVNPVLAVFGKPSPDGAFYEALYKELVQTQPLMDKDLSDLAQQRAAVIVNALVKEDGVAPNRVGTAAPKAVDKSAKTGVETALSLSVAGKVVQ